MIDLHMHTVYSDGTDTVEEILKKAQDSNLEIISITDHNSVEAYFEMEKNPELKKIFKGKIIVGTELKTTYNKINIELLAYGIDYKKINIVEENQDKVQKDILEYYKNVGKELGLEFSENICTIPGDGTKQFAANVFAEEILKYDDNKEIISKIGKKFEIKTFYRIHESNPDSPFYYDTSIYYKDINEVIEDIHNAGGLAFLAHGYEYPFIDKDKVIEEILKITKIDGAECEYPTFTEQQRTYIKELCNKYHKFMSGGTDYHAKNKPNIKLGTGINNNINISTELVENWIGQV